MAYVKEHSDRHRNDNHHHYRRDHKKYFDSRIHPQHLVINRLIHWPCNLAKQRSATPINRNRHSYYAVSMTAMVAFTDFEWLERSKGAGNLG